MIIEKIRAHYEALAKNERPSGHPTGSRAGDCSAKLQFMRFPEQSKPAPSKPRDQIRFEHGHLEEDWFNRTFKKIFPPGGQHVVGLSQEPFYFGVPLAPGEADAMARMSAPGKLRWTKVIDNFQPPTIVVDADGNRFIRNLLKCSKCGIYKTDHPDAGWCDKMLGFIVDKPANKVWVPAYPDWIMTDKLQPYLIEAKSMSNYGFRDALLGNIGWRYLAQLAVLSEATKADAIMVAIRKETQHLVELEFSRKFSKPRLSITRLTGKVEEYDISAGKEPELPPDQEWDLARVESPYQPGLLEQVYEHVRRVLLFDGSAGPGSKEVYRQYGPDFTCDICQGTGVQTLRKGGREPLKSPKPCVDCGNSGRLARTELSFPCSYCPVIRTCYPFVELEVDTKPHWYIGRDAYVQSGLTFVKEKFREG